MPSIPDMSGGGGSGGGDDTTPSSTPPPSSSDGQEAAAAAAEAAKKKAADALSQFSGEGIKTDSGDGAGLGGSGSGSGSGGGSGSGSGLGGDDTSPSGSGSGSGSASGQDAAAAAAEAAKKKAADALSEFSGEGIKTDSGDGAGLGGSGSGGGGDSGSGSGSESGSGSDPAADGKEAAEKAAEDAKKQASDALDKLGGEGIKTDQDGDGLLDDDGQTDGDEKLDHLKVKQGDKTFEMTEPDHDGKMDIKVGEGDGPAKDYKLDWPDGDAAKTDVDPQGTGDPGKPDADGAYHPGPDGKIHIEDGDLKITAERPDGATGPTVVTVDDGTGKPTTYTLGEDDTSPGGLADDAKKHLADALSGETRGDTAPPALGDTPDAKPDDLPKHSGTLDGSGASGGGGGGAHALSSAGLDAAGAGAVTGGSLGETPSLSEGVHSGVGAGQSQPAAPAFAPMASVGANGQAGQSMGGGMPMGGMGGGGQGGGDQERSNRAYRIEGAVFEPMAEPTGRIVGSLDDEEPPAPRRW
jgi:hypothetical protein